MANSLLCLRRDGKPTPVEHLRWCFGAVIVALEQTVHEHKPLAHAFCVVWRHLDVIPCSWALIPSLLFNKRCIKLVFLSTIWIVLKINEGSFCGTKLGLCQ